MKRTATDRAIPLLWERPEPERRRTPGPLSRQAIVRAALRIADAEGLSCVSFRKVAAALNVGSMRFYRFVESKEELLDLLVDAVFVEMTPTGRTHKDWKEGARLLAHRMRSTMLAHPWLADLLGGRPHQGPNALAFLEEVHRILHQGIRDIDRVLLSARTLCAYVLGALQSELGERRAEGRTGQSKRAWQASREPYLRRMIATGRFATLAAILDGAKDLSAVEVFDSGLECLLAGIEARLLASGD